MALEEARVGLAPAPPRRGFRAWAHVHVGLPLMTAMSAAIGFMTGAIASPQPYLTPYGSALDTIAIGLGIASLAAAARAIKNERLNAWRMLNGVLWLGVFAGYSFVQTKPSSTVAITSVKGWAVTTIAATALYALKAYLGSPRAPKEMNATAGA